MATEVRQGFQNRNNGKKGTQKSLTTVVIERSFQPHVQGIGKEELQTQNICKVQTEDSTEWETSIHSSDSTKAKGIVFPTPRTRDRGTTEAGLIRKDGKNRLDDLSNFIRYEVEKKTWRTPVCSDAQATGIPKKGSQLHLAEQVRGYRGKDDEK